jgi:nucleoside phosphorylase
MDRFTHESYTVACICPMGVELAAVSAMLDKTHPDLPSTRDQNSYTLGQIGPHNVVVAVMPEIGNNKAAAVAMQLLNDFKSIRFGLLVGIGGGIPVEDEYDIRLGDVVVSKPTATFGGVIQFDRGKVHTDGRFERTGTLNKPPPVLMANAEKLRAQHMMRGNKISRTLLEMLEKYPSMREGQFFYQGVERDVLFETTHNHQGGNSCGSCDRNKIVDREPRETTSPRIHYGTIGSSNLVVKDAVTRDQLGEELGVICVEMEAAGLMDEFPCLVIRGICDYADSHKNRKWKPYAAATAAAYAKELLSITPASEVDNTRAVGGAVRSGVGECVPKFSVTAAERFLPNKSPRPETKATKLLDPALEDDGTELYRRFRASLPNEPVSRDDTHARQARFASELMTYKYHAQGPWPYWLRDYLSAGHSVNIRDFGGKTPLHHALTTQYERMDKVRGLVEAGADVTMLDFEGQTPVDVAKEQDTQLFIFLLRTWRDLVCHTDGS